MKKKILIGIGVLFVLFLSYFIYGVLTTRSHSPIETVQASADELSVEVVYCRPYKKGRLIFGEESNDALVPHGKYWRLGANDATEITFNKDASFGGKPVKAGTYRMYAVPNADSWEVSLNSEVGKFGFFEPNYDLDVAKVNAPVQTADQEVEQFTIDLTNDGSAISMNFVWDTTKVSVPITQ